MKKLYFLSIAFLLFSFNSMAQEKETAEAHPPMSEEEMMKMWMDFIAPDDNHAYLTRYAGQWNYTNTFYMDPVSEPSVSKGTADQEMRLGGRYLVGTMSGISMGMPFEGEAMTAYDKQAKEFISTWIDNFGTGVLLTRGRLYGDTLITTGDYFNPMTNQTDKVRMVNYFIDEDNHVFEYFTQAPEKAEFKTMVITYERQKETAEESEETKE